MTSAGSGHEGQEQQADTAYRRSPQDELDSLFRDFLAATSPASLRTRYCDACRAQDDQVAAAMSCMAHNCGMADATVFHAVRAFVARHLELLADPDRATDDQLADFTRHIIAAGCIAPTFNRGSSGFIRRAIQPNGTLRGRLHGLLYTFLAWQAGDAVDVNAGMGTKDAKERHSEARRLFKDGRELRARVLRDTGATVSGVHKTLGVARSTARAWTGRRSQK